MKRWYGKGLVYCVLMAVLLAGCSSAGNGGKETAIDPNTPVTLKVAYMNEQAFYQTYGNIFSAKYPNVQFEVVSTMEATMSEDPIQAMIDLMEADQPDIVMLSMEQYEALAEEGRLYELDSMIQQSSFDLNGIVEGVVQLLRDAGGGKLYGLAPTFNTNALFYNKDLFAQYGIPEPTDFMTWEEVLQLAARFPTDGDDDSRIYGLAGSMFAAPDAFKLIQDIAAAKGLNYVNADATELTMSEPEWRDIFRSVVEGYQQKTIAMPKAQQQGGGRISIGMDSMYFNQGRAAMVVDNSTMINMVGRSMVTGTRAGGGEASLSIGTEGGRGPGGPGAQAIDWGVVTAPVDAATPDMTNAYTISQIFAVNAESSQSGTAWEFIQYVHSDEAAKIRSNTATELQSRIGYETTSGGVDLSPFYKLKPLPADSARWYPKGFRSSFSSIANEEIAAAASGGKGIDEAFDSLLERGADALAEANLSGEKEQGGSSGFGFQSIFIGG